MSDSEDTQVELSDEIAEKWDPERLLRMVAKRAGKGQALDMATRSKYERRMGTDFGNVRVYTGEFAQEVAKRHRAEAVTIGDTGMIMMGGLSQRTPGTTEGSALLAHELTHVAQSQRGLHRSPSSGSAPLATDEHEQEATEAEQAERAASGAGPTEGEKVADADAQREAIIERVLEMLADDERANEIRTGEDPFLP
jgi:hypothetical protein